MKPKILITASQTRGHHCTSRNLTSRLLVLGVKNPFSYWLFMGRCVQLKLKSSTTQGIKTFCWSGKPVFPKLKVLSEKLQTQHSRRHSQQTAENMAFRKAKGGLRTGRAQLQGVLITSQLSGMLRALPSLQRAPVKPGKQSHRPVMWWQGPLLWTHCGHVWLQRCP